MTTLAVILRKKKLKDGTYPLAIRLTKNRVTKFIHFGKSILSQHWNDHYPWIKKSHDTAKELNSFMLDKFHAAENEILSLEKSNPNIPLSDLKTLVKTIINGENTTEQGLQEVVIFNPSVYDFAEDYLNIIRDSGDENRYRTEKAPIDHLRRFMKGRAVFFSDLTVKCLKKFKGYLKSDCNLGERTAVNNLIILRTLFRLAIDDGVIDAKSYPFGRNKIRCKRPQSLKIGLQENELLSLEATILPVDHIAYHARHAWLLSYYFAGMRASDVLALRWDRLLNGRLYYAMSKNLKADSFKIPEKAKRILALYQTDDTGPDDLVLPFLRDETDFTNKQTLQKACHRELQRIGRGLNDLKKLVGLEKKLSMHVARHSFATIAGDKIPMPLLQRLFRHSCITTTINYMSAFMYKDLDDALDNVVNFNLKPTPQEPRKLTVKKESSSAELRAII